VRRCSGMRGQAVAEPAGRLHDQHAESTYSTSTSGAAQPNG